jgi:hypothetical protein
MRLLFPILLLLAPAASASHATPYGELMPESDPVSIAVAAQDPAAYAGKPMRFSGRITQVCQKQGCWLVLSAESGEFARVFMHDHTFSVPKDASGEAVVYGTLSEKKLSAEEAAHLKKDGAAAPAERELQIDATSVVIRAAG